MTPTTPKAELLRKIKALADQARDGEKENAQALLHRLMEKYGLSEADIEDEQRTLTWFRFSQEIERRLLNQIIYMVTGDSGCSCIGTYTRRPRKELGAECTAAERIEIEAAYAFFKQALATELDVFMAAFANKNDLFPPPERKKLKHARPRDLEREIKASLMGQGMETHTMRKALTEGSDTP